MNFQLPIRDIWRWGVAAITLQTPAGRLTAWLVLSVIIYISKYQWLEHLSLWQRLGFDWAPSIGLTRAYWLLMHYRISAAWERNPLIFLIVTVGAIVLLKDALTLKHQYFRTTTK